jgi:hypothetical protein
MFIQTMTHIWMGVDDKKAFCMAAVPKRFEFRDILPDFTLYTLKS